MGTPTPQDQKYVLGIECSNPSVRGSNRGEVGLAKIVDGGGLGFVGSVGLSGEARGSDGLMSAVDALCGEHGVSAGDIGRVVVSVGPGGYTALRVSVTVAKVLGEVIGCGVVAVPTAAVGGVAIKRDASGIDAVVALASKKGKAHCTRVVDGEMRVLGVIGGEGLVEVGAEVLVGDEFVPEGMVEAARAAGMEIRGIELTARGCLEASVGIGEIEPERLGVLYAREPDAVSQWRALGRGLGKGK